MIRERWVRENWFSSPSFLACRSYPSWKGIFKLEQYLSIETIILELLLVVTAVAIIIRRFRFPYTVALVLVGLALSLQQSFKVNLTPELIMALFVPPLVFEAALHINLDDLRQNWAGILLLAIPGVVVTMLIVGGILSFTTKLSLPVALVFGALISATDPVAVVAMFRALGVSKRLAVLVESESLLNDGTAIVLFNLTVAVALTGQFNLIQSLSDFVRISVGGTAIGLISGWIVSRLIHRIDDYLIETTLTTLLAFGSFLIAERLHFSGVLAVVFAGLIVGHLGPQGMSPTTKIVITNFWEYVAFLANSLIFLLIGLEINLPALVGVWQSVLLAIAAVFLSRIIVVYGFGKVIRRFSNPIPLKWLHVLNWGGLRGAIALALALSLPMGFGSERETLKLMAYGVVLFTLLIQSTTVRPMLRVLGLIYRSSEQMDYEKRHARMVMSRSALAYIDRRHSEGLISSQIWEQTRTNLVDQVDKYTVEARDALRNAPTIQAEEMDTIRREVLRSQRSSLLGLRQDGVISDDIYNELTAEIDTLLSSERLQDIPPQ